MAQGPRIYNLFPLLVGSVRQWEDHLPRIAAMGFDWVYLNPFHYAGFSGSIYAVKDYYRIHSLMWDGEHSLEQLLKSFCGRAGELGLSVMMDLVINHTSKDSLLAEQHPEWFLHEEDGSLYSPRAIDPADARKVTVWGDLAELDYHSSANRAALTAYFGNVIGHFIDCGIKGFRCDAAYQVPADVWSKLTRFARFKRKDAAFFAETLGCRLEQVKDLRSAGFDYLFNSAKWWDFKAPWLMEQYDSFRRIAPTIAFPESHDTPRLAADLTENGEPISDPALVDRACRQRYLFAAVFSTGVMMPVGFEYGFRRKLDVVTTRPSDWEDPQFDLTEFIAGVNRMKAGVPALNVEGPQWLVKTTVADVIALVRRVPGDHSWALTYINSNGGEARDVRINGLEPDMGENREVTPGREGTIITVGDVITLAPGEVRVFINP